MESFHSTPMLVSEDIRMTTKQRAACAALVAVSVSLAPPARADGGASAILALSAVASVTTIYRNFRAMSREAERASAAVTRDVQPSFSAQPSEAYPSETSSVGLSVRTAPAASSATPRQRAVIECNSSGSRCETVWID